MAQRRSINTQLGTQWLSGLMEITHPNEFYLNVYGLPLWVIISISTYSSKISMGAVIERVQDVDPLFTVCGGAPGFVSGWHHHHRLSLCELRCLSGVLLWRNVVIYFDGVPFFPLLASSASTSLSDCLHRMPFNSPQTMGLNFFYSAEGLDM